ncbi:hypothetical protein B4N89_00690 [Embleya scabrispora]|uniref:Uncharacterized protein n=1 Tax=Embleya scabrispora TaxID=159449 RepID=A0A1T3NRY0_9ACTN|nr:neocarzinostatin apoprotein domain-containing protein [Embleya scabrispora]OPC79657.1 hypothetical protein B4N89_00690 [Embleya scabrispora]
MIHPVEPPHDPMHDDAGRPGPPAVETGPAVETAGTVAAPVIAAFAAGLPVGALVLLGDALGGVVGMPVKAVRYMLLTTVLLTALAAAASHRWPRAGDARRPGTVSGVLACALLVVAALVPTVTVFGAALLAVGLPAGRAVAAARRSPVLGGRAATWWYVAVLSGLASAGVVCALLPDDPESALAICAGVAGALHLLVAVGGTGRRTTSTLAAGVVSPRRRAAVPRTLAAGYAGAAFAFVGASVVLTDLLLFRWTILGPGVPWRYTAALTAAALVLALSTVGARRPSAAGSAPVLLMAASTGPVLVATAPGDLTSVAGLTVAAAASALAAIGLDSRIRALDPDMRGAGPISWAFLGAVAAVVCRWGLSRLLSAEDASVLLAAPVAMAAVATAYGMRSTRGRTAAVGIRASGKSAAIVVGAAVLATGLLGPGSAPIAHAAEVPTVEVTATNALSAGQKVTVTGHGFRAGLRAVAVGQCSEGYTGPHQCALTAGATFVNVDSHGRLPKVVLTMVTSVHEVDCLTRQCVIGVGPLPGSNPRALVDANTVDVRLGFTGGAVQGDTRTSIPSAGGTAATEPAGTGDISPLLWSLTLGFLVVCLGVVLRLHHARPTRSTDTA